MKIFYMAHGLGDWGGSEIYTRDLVKELIKRGHELRVTALSTYPEKHRDIGVYRPPVFGHNGLYKFEVPLFTRRLMRMAREFKPDVVQSHGTSLLGLVGHFIKRDLKIPHVLLIELISSINRNMHGRAVFLSEKFLLPKLNYDRLLIWTSHMKDKFLVPWGIDERRIVLFPAALNLDAYDPAIDCSDIKGKYGGKLITCVKTLYYTNVMGMEHIIRAMKIVSRAHPEYKLLVFGEGNYKFYLENLTKKLGLENFIQFPGGVPPEVYKKVCAATDVAPHSFLYEFSTSISLLEYMAMGRPCVVTDIGSVREFVGDSALVVKSADEKSIAEGIIRLIENPKLRETLGRKARKRVEEKYSIKSSVDILEKIYEELTGK
jgi:glycosyltransferase involved in cell wall biosynthesis